MTLLSHRGFWSEPAERNTAAAFLRSWEHGFGIETDVRDLNGTLVISHDPPRGEPLPLDQFLADYRQHGRGTQLALNVKADGLQKMLATAIQEFQVANYFVFDMSIPDCLGYFAEGLKVYARQSELEPVPAFEGQAAGVWLDMFVSEWPSADQVRYHLDRGLAVCVVSPELHKRRPDEFWSWLRETGLHQCERLALCTDLPNRAEEFFHESD